MPDQEKDKQMQVDNMLDSLLASYSSVEPRPGLENRILAILRDAGDREASRGWWNLKWMWAGAAVAASIIVAFVLLGGRYHVAPPANTVVQTLPPAVQQPLVQQPVVQQPKIQSNTPREVSVPPAIHHRHKNLSLGSLQNVTLALSQRPAVFPTPTPLSEQEQLLLRYYASTPRKELIAQSHPDEPPVLDNQDQTEAIPDLIHIPQKLSNIR